MSKYKLVYSHWLEHKGKMYPIANGLPLNVIQWYKETAETENTRIDPQYYRFYPLEHGFMEKDSGIIFRNSNLNYYFEKHYGFENMIGEDQLVDNDDVYFMPVELDRGNIDFVYYGKEYKLNDQVYQYDFYDSLTPKVKEFISKGKLKILFTTLTEPSYSVDTVVRTEKYFAKKNVSGDSLCWLQGNFLRTYKEESLGKSLLGASHASLEQQVYIASKYPISRGNLGYACDFPRESDLNPNVIRPKKFMSWNRTMNRPHRIGIAYLALKYNFLQDGIFSFLNFFSEHPEYDLATLIDISEEELKFWCEKISALLPYQVDTFDLTPTGREGFQTNENNKKEFYMDCYLHLTSETQFDSQNSPFLSEKTYRPILNLQPFIYLGNYQGLAELHRLGFKTFHPYIDESYDEIRDPKERFAAISKEILRFSNMPIEQVHEWYYSLTDVLIYNQKHFLSLLNYNPLDDFFSTFKI